MSDGQKTESSDLQSPPDGWPVPRSAYIHVPFCRHRCGYCNFSVVADRNGLAERFLAAIDQEVAALERPSIETLFIGGGTPTQLSPQQLSRFLKSLRKRFQVSSDAEVTVEANPEDMTDEMIGVLVDGGVNRVSLGVQSFDDAKLKILERGHTATAAQEVVRQVASRIANVSIDLIFAAPNESLQTWQRDVDIALNLPIHHLSTYALTFEKGTRFWSRQLHGQLQPITESVEVDMYQHVREGAANIGLPQYEISSFSHADFQCQHNLAYWHGRGWYAAGPGAARFVNGHREVNHRSTTTYLRKMASDVSPVAESEPIEPKQYARERAAFGIRMIAGINLDDLSQETGVALRQECRPAIKRCTSDGLLEETGGFTRLTERGVLFADTVAAALLG